MAVRGRGRRGSRKWLRSEEGDVIVGVGSRGSKREIWGLRVSKGV